MSYPINQAITYTAVASTQGKPSDTFNYAWIFDDNTTANTEYTPKTWTTTGSHTATVMATDTTTLVTATATKTIVTTDWSLKGWISTGVKYIPSASTNTAITTPFYFDILVSGQYFINPMDYSNPLVIVVYNAGTNTRAEYSGLLGVIGQPTAACVLNSGPNSGKVLIIGASSGRYGFLDPATGNMTLSANSLPSPYSFDNSVYVRSPMVKLLNGKWLLIGLTNVIVTKIYDPVTDTWSNGVAGINIYKYMSEALVLPSGNVFVAYETSSYIYNYLTDTFSIGPYLPTNTNFTTAKSYTLMPDGKVACMTPSVSPGVPLFSTWREGDASFTNTSSVFPLLYVNPGATATNTYETLISTLDGNVVCVGGSGSNGSTTNFNTKTAFGFLNGGSSWVNGPALPSMTHCARGTMYSGRVWITDTNGILYYMAW